jgi:ribosome maturation factor RimP
MSANTVTDRVASLVTPILADLGLDLYDVEYGGGQLRVTLDARPGATPAPPADDPDDDTPAPRGPGVTLDVLALATRLISRELDHADPIPGHYTLEVTSPGLERTLRTPAHFARSVGVEVAVRLRDVANDERRLHGVLSAAGDDTFTVTRADGTTRDVAYDQVDRARTVFNWGPAPKPAKGKPRTAAARTQHTATPTAATDETTEAPAP